MAESLSSRLWLEASHRWSIDCAVSSWNLKRHILVCCRLLTRGCGGWCSLLSSRLIFTVACQYRHLAGTPKRPALCNLVSCRQSKLLANGWWRCPLRSQPPIQDSIQDDWLPLGPNKAPKTTVVRRRSTEAGASRCVIQCMIVARHKGGWRALCRQTRAPRPVPGFAGFASEAHVALLMANR